MENHKVPSLGDITRRMRETLKAILDFKFLIEKEKQGLKSNAFIDVMIFAMGIFLLAVGRLLFWNEGDSLFDLFRILFFTVPGFLILCYIYFAWQSTASLK